MNFGLKCNPSEIELFRTIPKSVPERIRKTFRFSFDEKRSKVNPIYSASNWGINLSEYEPNFQSESFRPRIYSDLKFCLDQSEPEFIRIPRIKAGRIGLIFYSFSSNEIKQNFRIGPETDFGIAQYITHSLGLNSNLKLSPGYFYIL